MRTLATAALLTLTAGTLLAAGPAAFAGDDDREVIEEGSCTGSTDWKVEAKEDDGRIEVEGEVDSNRAGQSWAWVLKHNGTVSARGVSTTGGRSGSFDVERKVTDGAGTDVLAFRARRVGGGEACRGSVTW